MATNVYYNGVQLHNVLTRQWDQEVVYDDSRTDVAYSRFRFRFEALLHGAVDQRDNAGEILAPAWIAIGSGTGSAFAVSGNAYPDICSKLSASRHTLTIGMTNAAGDEEIVFQAIPATEADAIPADLMDVDNGPKPARATITQIAGSLCWRLVYEIEACVVACARSSQTWIANELALILNNRWTVTEEMDVDWYLVNRIRGRLRLAYPPTNYDIPKSLVFPPLSHDFRRDKITFAVAANGLDCDWEVEDRQVFMAAPWPGTRLECSFSDSAVSETVCRTSGRAAIHGPPHANRGALVARLIQCLNARARWLQYEGAWNEKDRQFILENFTITETMGERYSVEAQFSLQRVQEDLLAMYRRVLDEKGRPVDNMFPAIPSSGVASPYSRRESLDPLAIWPGGASPDYEQVDPGAWLVCWLQRPCQYVPKTFQRASGQVAPPVPPTIVNASSYPEQLAALSLTDQSLLSEYEAGEGRALYTHCALKNRYISSVNEVQLPIARSGLQSNAQAHSSAFVKLVPDQWVRVIEFDSEAAGDWPKIPDPVEEYLDNDIKHRRLNYEISPYAPTTGTLGYNTIYRVCGRIVYGLSRAPTDEEKLATGVLPFMRYRPTDEQAQFTQRGGAFDRRIGPGGAIVT